MYELKNKMVRWCVGALGNSDPPEGWVLSRGFTCQNGTAPMMSSNVSEWYGPGTHARGRAHGSQSCRQYGDGELNHCLPEVLVFHFVNL